MSNFYHDGTWHVMESCWTCKVQHSIPLALHQSAVQGAPKISIMCPYGHTWVYKSKKQINEDEQVRLERDRLKQQLAQKDDDIKHQKDLLEQEERRSVAYRGHITRIKNRVGAGVCPCCDRSFQNLQRHMQSKHKEYRKEEVA